MRILKSIGLVVAGGVYVFLITKVPFLVGVWFFGLILASGLFCWGYFVLFNPKR